LQKKRSERCRMDWCCCMHQSRQERQAAAAATVPHAVRDAGWCLRCWHGAAGDAGAASSAAPAAAPAAGDDRRVDDDDSRALRASEVAIDVHHVDAETALAHSRHAGMRASIRTTLCATRLPMHQHTDLADDTGATCRAHILVPACRPKSTAQQVLSQL
jgi:hypothetical protein